MRLRNLASFLKVAQLGSFHAAAEQLHISQPTISARISALESELGTQLFTRDKSGTKISARGTQLLPYAHKLLAISAEMKQQLRDDAPERGIVRIGIADTMAHLWISRLQRHWHEAYPQISFEWCIDISPVLHKQLENQELDLALMISDDHSQLSSEPLCSYRQCWVSAPQLELDKLLAPIQAIAQHPILSYPRLSKPWRDLNSLFDSAGEAPMIHSCNSVNSLITLCEQGMGFALLPEPLVRESIAQGKLHNHKLAISLAKLSFCCAWRIDDERVLPRMLAQSCREIITDKDDNSE